MAEDIIIQETKGLPDEYLQMLLDYIRFLQQEFHRSQQCDHGKMLYRLPGGLDELIELPDDFDETPECFKGHF